MGAAPSDRDDRPEAPIEVGRVSGVFGVRGELKVYSYTRPPGNICAYTPWYLLGSGRRWRRYAVVGAREHGRGIVAALAGIEDRDAALALIGASIWIARAQLPAPDAGETYWSDLVGLEVVNREGVRLGRVKALFEAPANDVLVVVDGDRERLIPFVRGRYVLETDPTRGVVVDWDPRD